MVLTIKLMVSLCLLALLLVSLKFDLSRVTDRQFTVGSSMGLALMRLGVFTALFIIGGFTPTSDNVVYYAEAQSALAGGVIYRDFESAYGPLFAYLDAAAVYVWNSPKSIVLLAILVEIASFPLWLHLARKVFDEGAARTASLLYLFSPVPFFVTGVSGLNKSLGAGYLALAIFLLIKRRDGWAGFVLGLAVPGVKFLMALFAPAALVFARQRIKFVAMFVVPLLIVFGVLYFLKADLTAQFRMQLNYQTSGNLPFLLGLLGVDAASSVFQRFVDFLAVAVLAAVFLIHVSRTKTGKTSWLVHMCTIVGLTFMIFSKKSYSTYLVLFYFPLCLSVARNSFSASSALQFGLFNLLATLEPSLLFRWVLNFTPERIPSLAFLSLVHRNPVYISVLFIVINLALVSFYFRFLIGTWRVMVQERAQLQTSPATEVQFA